MKSHVFHDFDEFCESINGVESKMLLRNPERRVWTIDAVDIDGIDLQIGRLGSGNIARGQLRPDGFMLYVPLTNGIEYTANGEVVDRQSCAVLEPGCEFCISTKVEHDWCAVFLPTQMLQQNRTGLEPFLDSVRHTCRVTALDPASIIELRTIVQQIMSMAAAHPEFESTLAARNAAARLFKVASSSLGIAESQSARTILREGRPKIPRDQLIQNTMKIVEQQGKEHVSISDLTAAANVSERTLRAAFQEYFGVGPTRFVILHQLNKVHRVLKAANHEESTVSRILMDHGEYAFSRFAARYKRLFGESPSQTLRKSRR